MGIDERIMKMVQIQKNELNFKKYTTNPHSMQGLLSSCQYMDIPPFFSACGRFAPHPTDPHTATVKPSFSSPIQKRKHY
jgi:hypothetical protein